MIQVGQVIDKYELLERVGQGGMAIVYRGIDRSLKRVVAIKVLHKHLSDYQEARDRLEREAQAVAKLRHENILEIFDFAARDGEESYIVTEFIDGQTLKQAITERPLAFPEIGAMVMLQVCRALAHAHAAKVLHRDVKPENVMIRSDGVVKLMDFGISHMVDLERLTVTGQLLGSPAYMAPEHVEGKPIDFRTDVFAAGIVLYQLTVGRLPFEGKNPHEVLKRIAEVKFIDPRVANPRIGNRLGRVILKAMAARPDDRYPAIGEMVIALESYLEESGLPSDKIAAELARYFNAPASYEAALKERLVEHLARRGQELLADDHSAGALDAFDRVLTIDPQNARVIAILDGINRKKKLKTVGLAALLALGLGGGLFAINRRGQPPAVEAPPAPRAVGASDLAAPHHEQVAYDEVPPVDDPVPLLQVDAGPRTAPVLAPDAGAAAAAISKPTHVMVSPRGSEYRFGGDAWAPVPEAGIDRPLDAPSELHVRNPKCQPVDVEVKPGESTSVSLQFLAAHVVPKCDVPNADRLAISIDTRVARLGESFPILFGDTIDTSRAVTITFIGAGVDNTPIARRVGPNETVFVECTRKP